VAEDIGTGQGSAHQCDACLHSSLCIRNPAVRQPHIDVDWQAISLTQLGHCYRHEGLLGPGEHQLRGAHIEGMRDAAVAHGQARLDQLGDADAR